MLPLLLFFFTIVVVVDVIDVVVVDEKSDQLTADSVSLDSACIGVGVGVGTKPTRIVETK